jgi:hypothetical protein
MPQSQVNREPESKTAPNGAQHGHLVPTRVPGRNAPRRANPY